MKEENKKMEKEPVERVVIPKANMYHMIVPIVGTSRLVIKRFDEKVTEQLKKMMEDGTLAKTKRKARVGENLDDMADRARYKALSEEWDGVNASAFRTGSVDACRLCGYKMILAKLSIFIEPDGSDYIYEQIPLVRIYGDFKRQDDVITNTQTGNTAYVSRASYPEWECNLKIKWDNDQFKRDDVYNLLSRVGEQIGIGCGRWNSRNSCGIGWGCFKLK